METIKFGGLLLTSKIKQNCEIFIQHEFALLLSITLRTSGLLRREN